MKIVYIGCLAAFISSPAIAADQNSAVPALSGYGEISVGKFISYDKSKGLSLNGGTASVNANFDQRWNGQADFTYDALNFTGSKVSGMGAAAHIYWRDPSAFALGGFATFSKAKWAVYGTKIDIANQWTAGLESQAYLGDVTLYGQVWLGKTQSFSNPALTQIGIRAVVRYHLSDNVRLDGELNYVHSRGDTLRDTNIAAGAQINYRFDASPLTLIGRVQVENHRANSIAPNSTIVKKAFVGLRFSFGSTSLRDESRNGAAMDIYRPNLPALPLQVYFD